MSMNRRKLLLFVGAIIAVVVALSLYSYKRYVRPPANDVTATIVLKHLDGPLCGGSEVTDINGTAQTERICPELTVQDEKTLDPSSYPPRGKYKITGKAYIDTEQRMGSTGKKYSIQVMHFTQVDKTEKLSSSTVDL